MPDREGGYAPAVASDALVGTKVEFAGIQLTVTEENLPSLVEAQLPPQGTPAHEQDAAVMNWAKDGSRYLNEPETAYEWPNYAADEPGGRTPLMFAAATGKLAFPFLKPHLGHRPPFAPFHGPEPYLEPLNLRRSTRRAA